MRKIAMNLLCKNGIMDSERIGGNMYFELLWNEFSVLPEVEAIALGGSRAGADYDEKSDYDLYIYCTSIPDEGVRRSILEKCCQYMEIGNSFWELEDDCTLKDAVDIDILYRNLEDFSRTIHAVVEEHIAYNGYTTCMWHNLLHSRILYDRNGKLADLQSRYRIPYPEELRNNIVRKNMRLLIGNLVSVNHRTAAFLESYFDILFAWNRLTHPGEKRMVRYAKEQAEVLPADFEKNLDRLFQNLFTDTDTALKTIAAMVSALEDIIEGRA